MRNWIVEAKRLWQDESGATAIEYALIAGSLSIAIILGVAAIGGKLDGIFNTVGSWF